MLNRLLPAQIDNTYRGYKAALWIFGVLLLLRIAMSVNSIFNGYSVATTADGIPLDSFTPAGSRAVVYMFAAWGLAQLMVSAIGVLALIRYRSAVSFLFVLLLFDLLGRKVIHQFLPVATVGRPPGVFVNFTLLALMFIGLALSLPWAAASAAGPADRRTPHNQESRPCATS